MNVTLVKDAHTLSLLQEFFERVKASGGVIGWDIETTPDKDFFRRKCRTIQFGNTKEQYVIDLLAFCHKEQPTIADVLAGNMDSKPAHQVLADAQGQYGKKITPLLKMVLDLIEPVICSRDYLKVGVNLGFEYMTMYWNFGYRAQNFFDCQLAEKCIYAGAHSLKQYSFFSMEDMVERYLGCTLDKTLQTSFTIDGELSTAQLEYAALDTRVPITLRAIQSLILKGRTHKQLVAAKSNNARFLEYIDPLVTGDNLEEAARIEFECIGAFMDMHIHGERLDRNKWTERIDKRVLELAQVIKDLDEIFLPIVGSKHDVVTEEQIQEKRAAWKVYATVGATELALTKKIRVMKKAGRFAEIPRIEEEILQEKFARIEIKEKLKKVHGELGKKRTRIKKLAADCEGEALINYSSNAQLLKQIILMPGLKSVESLDDDTLEKFKHKRVMELIQKYHGLSKEIGTYGYQWAQEWSTKPCKEEGWLNPGDGRLHCVFNQFEAETGRSASEKPNGQNLPGDVDVRSCFIADPPNESIRISKCCLEECHQQEMFGKLWWCPCGKGYELNETNPEEYVLVTADMSGAELRIIAELANDPIWIEAFTRGEDVHSVGTHVLYGKVWEDLQLVDCAYFMPHTAATVLKNPNCTFGETQKQKCKCPEHKTLRDGNKSTNFLLAYGGGPSKLATEIKKTLQEAKDLMELHSQKFPRIWAYLEESGKNAKMLKKAFDMFGGRRLFPTPTWEKAKAHAKEKKEKTLRLKQGLADKNVAQYTERHGVPPKEDVLWDLTHRQPTEKEIRNSMFSLNGNIERQGKNHAIQGTNARMAKIAMGCGFSKDGTPYLWHTLRLYKAVLIKFVHDELVAQCPKRYATKVENLIKDAFKRAGAEVLKKVVMESEANSGPTWKK